MGGMKLKICVRLLGNSAPDLDTSRILAWDSSLWEIHESRIESLALNGHSDLASWGYSDVALAVKAPVVIGAEVTLYVLNVPLEDNYYFRRLSRNVACLSFYEIADALRSQNIPLDNVILRAIYACAVIYARKGQLPPKSKLFSFAHHETKGCIFDMAGIKTDIIFSTNRPILCEACRVAAGEDQVSKEFLTTVGVELERIGKPLYFQIADVVKRHPIIALAVSSLYAILLGAIGSIVATYAFDRWNDQQSIPPASGARVKPPVYAPVVPGILER
jgi:hypothetical protein